MLNLLLNLIEMRPCSFIDKEILVFIYWVYIVHNSFDLHRCLTFVFLACSRFLQYRDPRAQRRHQLMRCLEEGIEFHGEILNFRKDGTPSVNRLRLAPILDNDGTITHVIGVQVFSETTIDLNRVSYPVFKHKKEIDQSSECMFPSGSPRFREHHEDFCGILQLSDEVLAHNILSRLTPRDVASIGSACRRLRQLTKNESVRKMVCQNKWEKEITGTLENMTKNLGWGRLARELTTLEAVCWRKFTVEGIVQPSRCNFRACAVGNRLVLFGGEGVNMQPLDDTFILNLDAEYPEWKRVRVTRRLQDVG